LREPDLFARVDTEAVDQMVCERAGNRDAIILDRARLNKEDRHYNPDAS
jgi:hypothetical protein